MHVFGIKTGKNIIIVVLLMLALVTGSNVDAQLDLRSYQHGIDFVLLPDGTYYLFWSTTNNPPFFSRGSWPHDVYYSKIDPSNPAIDPILLISESEAQEPVSAAITENGRIMLTFEDGWDTDYSVAQRYGVYDVNLNPIRDYPQMTFDGGHSGHVAAVGNHFVVFYSDEWVDGGGVGDLGSGDDVLVKVYSADGEEERSMDVAVGTSSRDWWPLVAGSNEQAILVWQRFVDDSLYADLMIAMLNPIDGEFTLLPTRLEEQIAYYIYSVEYVPEIDRFLITGRYQDGGGFAYLLDDQANVIAVNESLPPIVRESQPVIQTVDGGATAVQAISPNGVMVLSLTADNISLDQIIADEYDWQYMGTDGIFTSPDTVYMVSLSDEGLVERTFSIHNGETVE